MNDFQTLHRATGGLSGLRLTVILLALLLSFSAYSKCPVPIEHPLRPRALTLTDNPNVVLIESECGKCSGWVLTTGVFVTAGHCLDNDLTATFTALPGSPTVKLTPVMAGDWQRRDDLDILILTGDTKGQPGLTPAIPVPGEPCVSLGYGRGPGTSQHGTLCVFSGSESATGLDAYGGNVDYGDSGGPVLNIKGELIGMQVQLSKTEHVFYTVPVRRIAQALQMLFKK